MPFTRREFLATGVAASLLGGDDLSAASVDRPKLAQLALDRLKKAGVSYGDIRLNRYQYETIEARERRISSVSRDTSFGYGVRALHEGSWGFAASNDFTEKALAETVDRAVAVAKANAILQQRPVKLSPVKPVEAKWSSGYRQDPFLVPLDQKTALLLGLNDKALGVKGAGFVSSRLAFVREDKFYASTEGSVIEQDLVRSWGTFSVTAVDRAAGDAQSRDSLAMPSLRGWEAIEEHDFLGEAEQAALDAVAKLQAKPVEPGLYDLVLDPSHLFLTIHESCGHPTELDRALGFEANYAGTSFLTPDKLGKFRYGSELVNMVADRTTPHALATVAYDDDGAPAQRWHLVKDGVFVEYQTTREQEAWLEGVKARGCAHADSWSSVVFQRMPNVSLDPGDSKLSSEDLIADVEKGVRIRGRGSYSIDQQRYNFQFGGQVFEEIKDGKVVGLLRDVAYQARTPDFWNALDGIASRKEYELGGSFYDGKGQPGQLNAVSHGCSPARFRKISVINTGRSS
ncbi:MAG: TldD/PmbA family protein [Acidobacteria bacterium]|nr:TldD/PmbA family protein [Acidobacteriota bacterium]